MLKIGSYKTLLIIVLLIFSNCSKTLKEVTHIKGVTGTKGMVVSAHPDATRIGLEILKQGGNAYDAAVAVHFALAVCFPGAGNIGGGGFMVYRKSNGESGSIDFREIAPYAASKNMYLDSLGNEIIDLSFYGALSVGVPGSVDGMVEVQKKLCKLPWKTLVQPSVELAQRGVVLTKSEANDLNDFKPALLKYNREKPFLVNDSSWKEGDTVKYTDLGSVLEKIRDKGRAGFYEGEVADLIVKEMKNLGGVITHKDLSDYKSQWRGVINGTYKGYKITSMPPPSSGGIALIQLLKILENFDLKSKGFHHPDVIHLMAEAEKLVYADRSEYLGDPDFYKVPVEQLLDEKYLDERRKIISVEKAKPIYCD